METWAATESMSVRVRRECPMCHGSGEYPYMATCRRCDGKGQAEEWVGLFDLMVMLRRLERMQDVKAGD